MLAFIEKLKDDAREQYRHELELYAMLAPHLKKKSKPPQKPKILTDT